MLVHVLQENLLRALTRVNRVVSSRPQLPVLLCVKLTATKDGLEITATNTETTETVWVGSKVEKAGEACVTAKVFFELIASYPPDTVHLSIKEETIGVSCGAFSAELPVTPAAEFPPNAELSKKEAGMIDKETLTGALSRVLFAAAADDGRPVLTGVKVFSENGKTGFVATDGYRLSLFTTPAAAGALHDAIVPARALSEVIKISAEEKEEKSISVVKAGEHQVGFVVADTTIITRCIDGTYPDYERIIPKNHTTRALLEKEPLLRAARSAAIFARDNANIVKMSFEAQKVIVSAAAAQVGKNAVELTAKIDGDGGDIAFNSRFLLDFLTNFPGEELLFEMTGSLNAGVFKPVKDENYLHIIMPVRVTS